MRKIDHLARAMGIENISASQVSEITKELDSQVEAFRIRPLESVYPVIWVEAVYEKIRKNGRVISMAVMVVTGVNLAGTREILLVQPMWNESEESYNDLQIWLQTGKEGSRRAARELADEYGHRFPDAIAVLEDSLSFYDFPMLDPRKISSRNGLERLNRIIRRRLAAVGVFPSEEF